MTTDMVEGDYVEAPGDGQDALHAPITALVAVSPARTSGIMHIASMTDETFDTYKGAMVKVRQRVQEAQLALMKEDVHYGVIPGTNKPSIFKSGAEVLNQMFGFAVAFRMVRLLGDPAKGEPPIGYTANADVHLGDFDGPIVAQGVGSCNSYESRYRYRKGARLCPVCKKDAIIKGKAEYGGGWVCFAKKGGCGAKWKDGDQAIENQSIEDVENENPHDLDNTICKMAKKRAYVDAMLTACAASDLFTQDVEDLPWMQDVPTQAAQVPTAAAAARPSRAAPPERKAPAKPSVPGVTSLTGEVTKVADGIWRSPDGDAQYDVTFKADGKTYHAMTIGAMAERMVREVKPSAGDPISVEGKYVERPWENSEGKKMPAVKELHDITRIVIRDEVTVADDAKPVHPAEEAAIAAGFVDEAHETFGDMLAPQWGERGFVLERLNVHIISADRKIRPKSGTYSVVGVAEGPRGAFAFVTDHDFDPPPSPGEQVSMTGKFVAAPPDGQMVVLGQIS